jgi:hypothetical protein
MRFEESPYLLIMRKPDDPDVSDLRSQGVPKTPPIQSKIDVEYKAVTARVLRFGKAPHCTHLPVWKSQRNDLQLALAMLLRC